jgi:hypothetical protein
VGLQWGDFDWEDLTVQHDFEMNSVIGGHGRLIVT